MVWMVQSAVVASESPRLSIFQVMKGNGGSMEIAISNNRLVCHQGMFNIGDKHFHLTFHLILGILVG